MIIFKKRCYTSDTLSSAEPIIVADVPEKS